MFSTTLKMPRTATDFFTIYASFTGTLMLIRSMFNDLIPHPVRSYIEAKLQYLFTIKPVSSTLTLVIEQSVGYIGNEVYEAAEIYLRTKMSPNVDRLKISKTPRQKHLTIGIEKGQDINDEFDGVKMTWKLIHEEEDKQTQGEHKQYFELQFDKKYKQIVMDSYLPYVLSKSKEIKEKERVVKLYTRGHSIYDDEYSRGGWGSINLEHPSNFETLAMDPGTKKMIIDDLNRFVKRKEFYKRVGKAWKRGYLLYGPPGTGKSSLIAAIANYLNFDIYDLELASCYSNSDLRGILLATANQSIIVIEDVDCNATAEVRDREGEGDENEHDSSNNSKITLSGLLNFCDGLWSSCGDERIIIFTTNHKEKLDPALLRPGRMDMHIHMSYCTFSGFKILASNYLQITDYPLFEQIEMLMEQVEVTPAEIAEELMKSDDVDFALNALVNCLEEKKSKAVLEDNEEKENRVSEKDTRDNKKGVEMSKAQVLPEGEAS